MKKFTISLMLLLVLIMIPGIIFASEEVSTEAELRQALETGKSVALKNDIVISNKTTSTLTTQDRDVGIVINGEGSIIIDGNGKTISSSAIKSLFEIYATGSSKINVTFKNVILETSKAEGRCIDTRTSNIVLNINNSKLTTLKGAYDQVITVGGPAYTTPIEINLNKSEIVAGSHYAIVTFNPVKLNINNCEDVEGFAAIYMKEGSAGSEVIINNSKITGTNSWSADSGDFGTITLEDTKITIDAKNSSIIAKETNTANQFVLDDRNGGNTIKTYNTKIETDKYSMRYKEGTKVILGDKTILVDQSITSEEMLKDFILSDTVCQKTGTNEYTIFKKYSITVKDVEGGKVIADKTEAIYGEQINVKVETAEGYEFKYLEISSENAGGPIDTISFLMPYEADITITPVFESLAPVVEIPDEVVIDKETEEMLLGTLEEALKENEELATLVKNNKVEVEVVLEDIKVKDKEKEVIEKAIEEKVKDIKVAKYIDISVNVKVKLDEIPDGKIVGNLEELKEKLTFTVSIPTDLPKIEEGYSRTYYIVRNHNGVVEILETKVTEDGKSLNFDSDKFSTYAIAYVDEKIEEKVEDKKEEKDETPKTGTVNFTMYVVIAVVAIILVKSSIKRKNGKYSK